MNKNSYQVLHCHTTLSDGTMTHRGILDKCNDYNIGVVAFTDHDILIPKAKFQELMALSHPVKFISGIEISATGIVEVKGGVPLFHIIGLFVDHKNKQLQSYCLSAKVRRVKRHNQIVKNLQKIGFVINEEEITRATSEGTVGRPHIARALLTKEKNQKLIKETLENFRIEALRNFSPKERYKEVENHDTFQQIFDLFLREDSFIQGIYIPYTEQFTLDEAVTLIRTAGGIAILAHPTYYRKEVSKELVEKLCRENRIDGIETVYGLDGKGATAEVFKEDIFAFSQVVKKYNLIAGGGGDFHTPEDFERLRLPVNIQRMEETKEFLPRIFSKWPEYKGKVY